MMSTFTNALFQAVGLRPARGRVWVGAAMGAPPINE